MRYKKNKVKKNNDISIITTDRLKPCKYCSKKVENIIFDGEWMTLGCNSPKCSASPKVCYKKSEEQEVFGKWNEAGGDCDCST